MTQLTINAVTGGNFPYTVYICDVYGSNCILVTTILGPVPSSPSVFLLPPPFDAVPALMLKIVDTNNCEKSEIIF